MAPTSSPTKLSPFDPKNPYDDHAAYYFARAALAQSLGRSQDAEDAIQEARTNYGVTVTNRYLKTYLHFFSGAESRRQVRHRPHLGEALSSRKADGGRRPPKKLPTAGHFPFFFSCFCACSQRRCLASLAWASCVNGRSGSPLQVSMKNALKSSSS